MTDIIETLRVTTKEMANAASVPMALWDRHSNACLDAANWLEMYSKNKTWRCFHCDDVFTSEHEARLHFGATEDSTPACRIAGAEHSLLQELRRVENELADLWHSVHSESTEAARAYFSQNSRHQRQLVVAEELGYERGLRDARTEDASRELLECIKDARRLLTDQDAIDLGYVDSIIARAEGSAVGGDA